MRYRYAPVYIRSIKIIKDKKRLSAIHKAVENFQEIVEKSSHPLGLKRLRGNIWEFRATIKDRILIRWTKDFIEYGIVGTHDKIRNYIKHC